MQRADTQPHAASGPDAEPARGHHWFLDLTGCQCDPALLADAATLRAFCLHACTAAGMQVVGDAFHQFAPVGVTGVVLLAESHLSVHTWPELRFAAVDVYVCDHNRANASRGQALTEAVTARFQATTAHLRDHARLSLSSSLSLGQTVGPTHAASSEPAVSPP